MKPIKITPAKAMLKVASPTKTPSKKASKGSIWQTEIEFTPAFGDKEKRRFFQMLSVLLDSGLSISDGFEVLIEQEKKQKPREILSTIQQALTTGTPLSQALENWPTYFASFECSTLRMAENSGQLVRVLNDLGALFERRIRLKQKITQALAYPVVVLIVAGGVLGFMLGFVVPMFKDIFDRFDAELPRITQTILTLSETLQRSGWLILGFIALVTGVYLWVRKQPRFQQFTGILLQKTPLIGPLNHKIQLSRFAYNLSMMLQSGVSLDKALDLMGTVVNYHPLSAPIPPLLQSVSEGKSFHEAVSDYPVFPVIFKQMVRVGEQTGRLPDMLERLAKNLEEEGENGVKSLTTLLEPLLILAIGGIVALVLVAMYLPMFELSNTIST